MNKIISVSLVLTLVFACYCESGFCRDIQLIKMMNKNKTLLGGLKPVSQNSNEIDSIARFAVLEHNKKQVISYLGDRGSVWFGLEVKPEPNQITTVLENFNKNPNHILLFYGVLGCFSL